ncbi:beta-1,4-xylanase [Chthonomonas calidirosea]|uniref:Beta-xylanase n=1 Tax=Chthonomonas calidirosea (strain DSM 23976 / ICMP 18418 / T49) TaxID=1303518 RepID=S0ETI5_CHTCT|nr:endo-1,4-beta-xylanase [Chthonomonas calidirosea]CCW34445.1 Beta-1,4-xylanase [Chthonomonas calidirosea T49]CEK14752.1 beta-1,4-xylanase [Chthonomonas calidirosea]
MTRTILETAVMLLLGFFVMRSAAGLPPYTRILPDGPPQLTWLTNTPNLLQGQVVSVEGQPFTEALELQTLAKPQNPWDAQIVIPTVAPVHKGDVLLGIFYVRSLKAANAQTEFIFERAGEPYTKSVEFDVQCQAQWQKFYVPFKSVEDYTPGEAHVCFRLGYAPQTLLIGGIELRDYGPNISLSDLPTTPVHYDGEEPNAAWRKEAEARIRQIRMAPITIEVLDSSGKPVPGAQVHIAMLRHAFPFGSAVNAVDLLGNTPDDEQYRQTILKLFNRATIENQLKWQWWVFDRQTGPKAVQWLNDHHISVRGHNLVWPTWRYVPANVAALKDDPKALAQAIDDHIRDELGALKGQCAEWDVVNEPVDNHEVYDALGGLDAVVHWYQLAHEIDPTTRLFINDYNILAAGGTDINHQNRYAEIIQYLLDHHAPLQGIGVQCHFGRNLTPPTRILQILDRFAKFGLPIEVTELDINVSDPQTQARYMRDFLTAAFSHPAVSGIVMWGFWEGAHWIPQAALFSKDWRIRPVGQAWEDMVFHRWWTDEKLTTNAKGICTTRGFLGDYVITVNQNGKVQTMNATLEKPMLQLVIRMP